jgi:hypothetical protein
MVQDQTTQTLSAAENARIDAIAAHGWAEQALVARHQSQQNSDTIRTYATAYFAASLDRLAEKSARTERHSLEHLAALLLPVMIDLDRVRAASDPDQFHTWNWSRARHGVAAAKGMNSAQQTVGTVRTIRTLFADSLEHLVVRILSAERDRLLRSREQMLGLKYTSGLNS